MTTRTWLATGAILMMALTGCASTGAGHAAPRSTASHEGSAGGIQAPVAAQTADPQSGVVVTHVTIPDIGVSSDIELLGLDSKGALTPPVSFDKAGWYSGGVLPGHVGPAIIAGHIDSVTAPAVFARLHEVTPGMKILVALSDGSNLTFVADKQEVAPKTQFPSSSVYGNVPTPQLRVITCDGTFNPKTGHYDENLVVFATLST